MTSRGQSLHSRPSLAIALAFSLTLLGATATAHADSPASTESGSLTAKPAEPKPWWQDKFAGSFVDLTSYVGSGTFYVSDYRNPYVSTALFIRPTYKLGTKYELSLNARVYLEEEFTQPDNPTGRRFSPLDSWVWLSARNLYTAPRSKIRISGVLRGLLPTSYESLYANTITVLTAGLSASRAFEFGRPDKEGKKWELALSLGSTFGKYLQTSIYRGNGPGDTSGCRAGQSLPAGGTALGGEISGAASDRCGGPLNTNFAVTSSANVGLSRGRYSLGGTLLLINQFRYAAPDNDALTAAYANHRGRSDATWGIISVGYKINDHLSASAGLSSYQPALDSRYQYPRFPFFDFSGTNANNFTQVFVGVNGTL
ncbi:MAG TPA: hypothetical protein VFH73_21860 [Polyangia bacterium]|nr:hypothetical protein [Polyangia bacterium]